MAIPETTVEVEFTDVVVGVPLTVDIQTSGVRAEVYVKYGIDKVLAVQDIDYLLEFAVDLITFEITPLQPLLDKIGVGINVIYVGRDLSLTSDFDNDDAFVREKLVYEFDRVWMALQRLDARLEDDVLGAGLPIDLSAYLATAVGGPTKTLAAWTAAIPAESAVLGTDNAAFLAAANALDGGRGFVTIPAGVYTGITAAGIPTTSDVVWLSNYARNGANNPLDLPGLQFGVVGSHLDVRQTHTEANDFATFAIYRSTTHTGGVASNVNAGLYVQTVKNNGNANNEWAISGVLYSDNNTTGLGDVAVSGVAFKRGLAQVFGGHFVASDANIFALDTDVTSIIATEMDSIAVGLDHPTANDGTGLRHALEIVARTNTVLGWNTAGGNDGEGESGVGLMIRTYEGAEGGYFRYGMVIDDINQPASSPIGTGIAIKTSGAYGIDISQSTLSGSDLALRLTDGQRIAFGAADAITMFYQSGLTGVFVSNVAKWGIDNAGSMWMVDGIAAPATQAGYAKLYIDVADGDFKIKYGDGTVKTIVVDT